MSDHKIRVDVDLNTDDAKKKLDQLTKDKKKIEIDVDSSKLDEAAQKADKLKNKSVKVDTKVTGKESIDATSKSLQNATKSATGFGNSLKGFAKFGVYLNVFQMIQQGARSAVEAIQEIDSAIVDLQMATGESYQNIRQLVSGYNDMAKELGATTTELAKGADTWLRQGQTVADTNTLLKDTMVLSKVANIDSEDSSSYLTAMMKGYHKAVDEVSEINDSLTSIDLAAAVDAGGLAEATSRVAASADLAGISLNKLLGYEAAVGEASQESMSVIGNSFKTIFTRMSDIKSGNLELIDEDGTTEKLSDVEIVLDNVGIQLRSSTNEFRDFDDVLDDTAAKWDKLSSVQKAAVSKAFAGTRQANRFQLLMENYDKALDYEKIANNSAGTAQAKFEDAYLNSLEAKQKSLQASFESLSTNLISRDTISGIMSATQALIEFLDKTQLLKGALAGLTAGGLVKGFTMLTASLTQGVMQINNFAKALSLIKVGNIGEDAIQQLSVLTDGLSQNQLKAVLSSEALSTAQRMQILQNIGLTEAQSAATLSTMGLSTAQGAATATTATLSGTLKGLWATLLANPIALTIMTVTAGVTAWNAYSQAVEESIQRAKDITSAWEESNSALNDQITKYRELKSQLDSGSLTPDEEYNTRQQILDLQTQITSQYGDQVQGVQLVNGELDAQIAKLQQIAAENAKTEINKNQDTYDDVAKQMEKEREYDIGAVSSLDSNQAAEDIYNLAKQYEDLGIKIEDVSGLSYLPEGTSYEIRFEGDASQAEKVITDFMNDVSDLEDKYADDLGQKAFVDTNVGMSATALKQNQEILDNYQESYRKFLEMDMYAQGFGDGSVADTFNKYTDAINNYNSALASGDTDAITKARAEFNELSGEVDTILSQSGNEKFSVLFDDVADTLDEATIKAIDFNDALNGELSDGSVFKDTAEDIKTASDNLKTLGLDVQQVRDALLTDGVQDGEEDILALAEAWGLTEESIQSQDDAFQEFLSVLSDAGIIIGDIGSATDTASSSFSAFSTTVETATSNLATLKDIMSESVSGAGLSSDNVKAFREMFGDDAEYALEKTVNGYHLNKDALAQLQAQQESLTKTDYLSALSDQYDLLRENAEQIANMALNGGDTSGLEVTRQGILDQISTLQDLQYQYESANSAYQQWQSAMSGGEEGDMYDSIFGNIESAEELYDKGLTGTNKFREFVDLMSNQDLSTASNEEIVAAYESAIPKIKRYFTEGQEGAQYFLEDIQNINSEWAHMNEDGSWDINFGVGNDQEIADALGIDVEAVQSVMRKLSDYGFDINLDQPVETLAELKESAISAQEALANMDDTSLSGINLDSNSFSEVSDNVQKVEEYIRDLDEQELDPKVKTDKLEQANEILEYLIETQNELVSSGIEIDIDADELDDKVESAKSALEELKGEDGVVHLETEGAQEAVDSMESLLIAKEQINSPAIMSVDSSQVDGELGSAIAKIQEYQSAVQDLNVQTQLKAQGVDIDTSDAQSKVDSLAAEIQGINPDITAKLNIDTSSASTIQSSIQGVTPEIMVKAGVDASLVSNYTPGDKDAKVKFSVDSSSVDAWKAPNKTATLTYNITTSGILPGNKERTLTYNIQTNGSVGVNGSAHAYGTTVKSYRFNNYNGGRAFATGDWSVKKNDTALVGELGKEIIVRNGHFFTVGDNGAEFANIKSGDIIFNHKQTKALLENGYVASRGKMIGGASLANGSAYSSGSGKFNVSGSGSQAYSSSSSKKTSSSSSSSKSNKSSSSKSNAEKEFEEKIDEIEILLDRMDRALKRLTDSIETYSYNLTKQSSVADQAMNKIRTNLTTLQSAYNRYIQEANSVGLDESWKKRVQNGEIDIKTITNESLSDQISEYQDWWNSRQCKIYLIAGTSPQPYLATA